MATAKWFMLRASSSLMVSELLVFSRRERKVLGMAFQQAEMAAGWRVMSWVSNHERSKDNATNREVSSFALSKAKICCNDESSILVEIKALQAETEISRAYLQATRVEPLHSWRV